MRTLLVAIAALGALFVPVLPYTSSDVFTYVAFGWAEHAYGADPYALPVAGLPMQAVDHGAHLVILNQSNTYIDPRADIVLNENTAEIIPAIVERVLYGQHD